ncbi:MAG: C_GCAxxG_C_C family protein [Chloroflexi bacterium]|nr:C_GCAxxG_C_C family protein [Chloroflexota bacterium]
MDKARYTKHQEVEKRVVTDFIKALSCSYSTTKNLGRAIGVDEDDLLLRSVVGFSSGLSTMGDTCGAVNGGVVVLGKRFPDLPSVQFYHLCSEFYRRLEDRMDTPDCGKVHGGKHLANNFRRAILTGKNRKCTDILKEGSGILVELTQEIESNRFVSEHAVTESIVKLFEENSFHCGQSVISEVSKRSSIPVGHIYNPSRGFCGGIGFNGTLCGAVAAGVLCLGLKAGVDLSRSGYKDTARIMFYGLIKSDGIFRDEKRFAPAKLYEQCREVYRTVEGKYGGVHCKDILSLRLDTENGVQQYLAERKIDHCRNIVQTVADVVVSMS